jgi:hypothetical protein
MKRQPRVLWTALGTIVALAAAAVLYVTRAGAGGIPATGALVYSGVLDDANGAPLTGSKEIRIDLYDAGSAGAVQCTVTQTVALANGHFQIALPDTCTQAVQARPDLWIEVTVGGESLGRTKLGAVPYAVEAARASGAVGTLGTQIVPAGAVMAFDLTACPEGWTPLADAQGRVIVGTGGALARNAKVGADQVTLSSAQMPAHTHSVTDPGHAHTVDNTINYGLPPVFSTAGNQGVGQASISSRNATTGISLQSTGGGQPFDNRQASLALLYCKKN